MKARAWLLAAGIGLSSPPSCGAPLHGFVDRVVCGVAVIEVAPGRTIEVPAGRLTEGDVLNEGRVDHRERRRRTEALRRRLRRLAASDHGQDFEL